MSRAFLKNESAEDPVVIPARAPLPPGVPNYVTMRGLSLLKAELDALKHEHASVQTGESDESERTRQLALLNGRIGALNQRIATANVVDVRNHAQDEIRFGARVNLRSRNDTTRSSDRQLTIVGVDEADAAQGRIAFTAPIARLILGKHVGDVISMRLPRGENVLEITGISYEVEDA